MLRSSSGCALVAFALTVDKNFSWSVWAGENVTADRSASGQGVGVGAALWFGDVEEVEVTVALSFVDVEGARRNLDAEGARSFDACRAEATAEWEAALGVVSATGAAVVETYSAAERNSRPSALVSPGARRSPSDAAKTVEDGLRLFFESWSPA